MSPRKGSGNDRRLKWGDGWTTERTKADGTTVYLANWREPKPDGSKPIRSKQFPTLAAAESHLRDLADKRARDEYTAPERLTVAELIAAYLERGAYDWEPATRAAYRQRADAIVNPVLGSIRAVDLTAPRVQHWVDGLVKRGLAANTIDGAVRVISGAFKEAVRLGVVATNPVTGTKRPAIRQAPVEVWTTAEVKRVMAAVADEPMWSAAYRLALTTGLRPGELRAVRWSDLDLERGVLMVRRTMTKDADGHPVMGVNTKSKRQRAIALAAAAATALRVWRTKQIELRLAAHTWHDPDLVFTTANGGLITQRHWQGKHDAIIVAANVPRIVPHGMRHTNATLELEAGTHPKIVSERLGHSRIEFTLNRYSHVSIDLQRAAADALNARLFDDDDATTSDGQQSQKG